MKKVLNWFLVCLLMFSMVACDDNNDIKSVTENVDEQDYKEEGSLKEGIIFTTEYEIEDYVENAAIVSKNDGLLYGVVDDSGQEIIPVKYDNLEFINKDEYLNDKCENVYMLAEYEDTGVLYNTDGKIIMESENELGFIKYYMKVEKYDSMPVFYEITDKEYIFYDKDMNVLGRALIQYEYHSSISKFTKFISDKCFVCPDEDGSGILLYDFNGNLLRHFKGYYIPDINIDEELNTCVLSFSYSNYKENPVQIVIDSEGNILEEKEGEHKRIIEYYTKSKGNKEKYNLYSSNGTWKLEDLKGNTLYDDRYYDTFEIDGENNCYCLVNENNQIMMINRNGEKCIEYGILETTKDSEKVTMLRSGSKYTVGAVFEGKYGVMIPMKSLTATGYDIYYFGIK